MSAATRAAGRAHPMPSLESESMEGVAPAMFPSDSPRDMPVADRPQPGFWSAAQQRTRYDTTENDRYRIFDVQWQTFSRLRRLSTNHASAAWELRHSSPVSAYALAYLFLQPDPAQPQRLTVRAATRVWKAGPESQRLAPLLASLTEQVHGRDPRLLWDLREEIANRSDDDMHPDAVYAGLGLSTLDTYTGTFAQACQQAESAWDIPGGFLYLTTGSDQPEDQLLLIARRHAAADRNLITTHTHRALSQYQWQAPMTYAETSLQTLYDESGYLPVLEQMWWLDRALHEADADRREHNSTRNGRRRNR